MAGIGPRVPLSDKDAQLLWARAAGLCSFPECRKNLARFSKTGAAFHIGENAHMHAYSLKGPRGRAGMSPAARDSYGNCILLCPTCHTLADKNKVDYPVSLLRRFKAQHESWVAESLYARSEHIGPSAQFYRTLLGRIEGTLHLTTWRWLSDSLMRDMLPADVLFDEHRVTQLSVATLWPRTRPKLEQAIQQTWETWRRYVKDFMSFAEPSRSGDFFVRQRPYEGASGYEVYRLNVKADAWSRKNYRNFVAYVSRLNTLLETVRAELNPAYRQDEGRFTISGDGWIAAPRHTGSQPGAGPARLDGRRHSDKVAMTRGNRRTTR